MTKFYHGQRVKAKITGSSEFTVGRLSKREDGRWFLCQEKKVCAPSCESFVYTWLLSRGSDGQPEVSGSDYSDLTPVEKTLDTLEVGDVVHDGKWTRTVLGIAGKVVLLSLPDFPEEYSGGFTFSELKKHGYSVIQPEPPKEEVTELTIDQVAEKFGLDPRCVRIKKEE